MKNLKQQRKLFDVMLKQYYKDLLTEALTEMKDIDGLVIHWHKIEQYEDLHWHIREFKDLMTYKGVRLHATIGLGGINITFHFPFIEMYIVNEYSKQPFYSHREFIKTRIDGDVSSARTRFPAAYKKFMKCLDETKKALEAGAQDKLGTVTGDVFLL